MGARERAPGFYGVARRPPFATGAVLARSAAGLSLASPLPVGADDGDALEEESIVAPSWSAGVSRDFWKYWAGQTTSNLGSSFTEFILPLLIFKLTGSALNLAVSTALWNLPYLLFGLVIGAWVDRVDRRRLMIAVDVARAGVIATIPLLGAMDRLAVWWIYVVIFTSSTVSPGCRRSSRSRTCSACHRASGLLRVPMRSGFTGSAGGC